MHDFTLSFHLNYIDNDILYVKITKCGELLYKTAEVAELGDAVDSKSTGVDAPCGFESRPRHQKVPKGTVFFGTFLILFSQYIWGRTGFDGGRWSREASQGFLGSLFTKVQKKDKCQRRTCSCSLIKKAAVLPELGWGSGMGVI